jgi:hypothetical protein
MRVYAHRTVYILLDACPLESGGVWDVLEEDEEDE